jgi:hypothetical protein
LRYYLVWAWYKLSPFRLGLLRRQDARRIDVSSVLEKKQAAIDTYLRAVAPGCGKPFCGVLPRGFLTPFRSSAELVFEAETDA